MRIDRYKLINELMRQEMTQGYHDPTAGKAIRRARRAKRRRKGSETRPLTYLIGEVQGFPVILVRYY